MAEPLSMDQAFIRKLKEIILANTHNENFGAEEIAKEAGMSRVSLHRRLKKITNKDISQFIREVRLVKAMELLRNNEGTVAEVAFMVGFGSATYFTRCFHEYFGFPPGEVRRRASDESLRNQPDEQALISSQDKEKKVEQGSVKIVKSLHHKNMIICSLGILLGLLFIYFLYVLIANDIGKKANHSEKSIVVLPFKNLSNDTENQYFADGIMEDILNHLFRISELRVISRTTAEHFRENQITSPEIAKMLDVNYVLEGSVLRSENKVRIFVQLIDARNDQHILSEKYEGNMTNIFELQSDIAKKVSNTLEAALSREEIGQLEKMPTNSPQAYDYYLKARFLVNKANDAQRFDISREGLMSSIQYYEKAIAADDRFEEAYAGMADAWYNLSAWGWYQPYFEGIRKARDFSSKALEIDTACSEALAVKGACLLYPERRFEEARRELLKSIRLNPNFSVAHQWYAQLLMITGPIEEARVHMDRVLELEPYFWMAHNLNSWICYFERKNDKGIDACLTGRDLNQYSLDNDWLFVIHYVKLGDGENAARELKDIISRYLKTDEYENEISDAYKKSGIRGLFTWLIDLNIRKPVPLEGMNGNHFYIAWWYAILGDKNQSVFWLKKASESQYKPYHYFDLITTNPDFDFLRDDPVFIMVLDEAGLLPYNKGKAK
ncbi:MAG: helix-turn-helix domain-containing protein [Bacteroidales bacterium]|nr:helix-turn-helix domain-containing protein [Bacteroidales bacterium]